jgi:hypothetical protein
MLDFCDGDLYLCAAYSQPTENPFVHIAAKTLLEAAFNATASRRNQRTTATGESFMPALEAFPRTNSDRSS